MEGNNHNKSVFVAGLLGAIFGATISLSLYRSLQVSSKKKSSEENPKEIQVKKLELNDILSVQQFTRQQIESIFSLAQKLEEHVKEYGSCDILKGKVMANLFFEPSTRTSCSFHAAMLRLGGTVIDVPVQFSSVKKGETLSDTVSCLECYTNAIVIRHPEKGAPQIAAERCSVPILNAGDGAGEHPTQALLDLYTIQKELGSIDGKTVCMVGDLKYGRTVHSLARVLGLFKDIKIIYVSPSELALPDDIKAEVAALGVSQSIENDLNNAIKKADVLYVTRIQKERMTDPEAISTISKIVVTNETMKNAKTKMCLMHPLPRVGEIAEEVDSDPRAAYFREMKNGMYVRMAILAMMLK